MLNVLSLCDGIGTGKLAFDQLGIKTNYYGIEKEQYPRFLGDLNVGEILRPLTDLLDITPRHMLLDWPSFDYVICGFSCKSLSRQSNGDNLEGSSKILFDCMAILALAKHRNPNVKFLIENVYSMTNEMKKVITEIISVDYIHINSKLVSGQSRDRLYWCNWENEQPEDRNIIANTCLEYDALYLKAWSRSTRYKDENGKVQSKPAPGRERYYETRFRKDGKSNTLVTGGGCQGMSTKNFVETIDGEDRPLTVRECARLQTLPDNFDFSNGSDNQAYKAIGNGWTLEVIKHLLRASL